MVIVPVVILGETWMSTHDCDFLHRHLSMKNAKKLFGQIEHRICIKKIEFAKLFPMSLIRVPMDFMIISKSYL